MNAQAFFHHRDHLKSIRVITDASGAEVSRTVYRAYGEKAVQTGSHAEPKGDIGNIDLRDWNVRFAKDQGLEEIVPVECVIGQMAASTFEAVTGEDEPTYWRVWHSGARGRVATITYTSAAEDKNVERHDVDRLIASLQWLW